MGQIKNMQIEISNWLNSDRNYEDGVYLYSRYGSNQVLKSQFPGRDRFFADKLAYELGKLIGVSFRQFRSATGGTPGDGRTDQSTKPLESNVNNTLPPVADRYPPVITRVIAEMSRLYNERDMLKKQQNAVPDENTDENVAKRQELIGMIDAVSERLKVLYTAKKAFLEEGILPAEVELFPAPGGEHTGQRTPPLANDTEKVCIPGDTPELLKLRNTLRSSVTRARNMLEYQSQKKEAKPNPMPACPKRTELEDRLKEKEAQLADVEEKLKLYAVQSETDPGNGE